MRFAVIFIMMLTVSACGFRPIYATPESGAAPVNRQIMVGGVSAPQEAHVYIVEALRDRMAPAADLAPKYELFVKVDESAQRLAVQIDATVTRYNYRLTGKYQLRDLATGKVLKGTALAVTSYNIVTSQYSTLFAERTAREKAARILAEEIERDIILRLADPDAPRPEADAIETPLDPEEFGESQRDSGEAPFLIGDEEQ